MQQSWPTQAHSTSGRGTRTLYRKSSSSHTALCNQTIQVGHGNYYLVPPNNTWWACNTGLTPYVSAAVMDLTQDFCVLTQVMSHILYHSEEALLDALEDRRRQKREPVAMTLALLLGLGGAALGVGTGTAALIQGSQQLAQLQLAIDTDLRAIENSISLLEKSLTSLSEVVLQNRRELDLLFLRDKGLCAALGEECFYADHAGIVKDSMAKLRDRLNQWQRDREA